MRKIIAVILLVLLLHTNILYAGESIKFYGGMQTGFSTGEDFFDSFEFITQEEVKINENITIPAGALIKAKVQQFQKEKRWHKSGFLICKLTEYSLPDKAPVNISDEEIHFVVRKYEVLNKKEAGVLGTEIVLTQAAAIVASCFVIFAPVDIAYFFTKGAIKREKNPNWFKSGVMEAYDNSIFWFQLKGKPIELAEGDNIKLKSISKEKADKISVKIEKHSSKKGKLREKELAVTDADSLQSSEPSFN